MVLFTNKIMKNCNHVFRDLGKVSDLKGFWWRKLECCYCGCRVAAAEDKYPYKPNVIDLSVMRVSEIYKKDIDMELSTGL